MRDVGHICARCARWLRDMLKTRFPNLDPAVVNHVKVWSPCTALGAVASMTETADALQFMANRKALVRPNFRPNC